MGIQNVLPCKRSTVETRGTKTYVHIVKPGCDWAVKGAHTKYCTDMGKRESLDLSGLLGEVGFALCLERYMGGTHLNS